jgi:hypothetical protein
MSRWRDVREWLFPGRFDGPGIPALESNLRPNTRLDDAAVLARFDPLELEDAVVHDGTLVVSAGSRLVRVSAGEIETIATFDGRAGALASTPEGIVAAVNGVGLVRADAGRVVPLVDDSRLRHAVTAISALPDGGLLVTVGSTETSEWVRALVAGDRSGLLLRVGSDDVVTLLADGLAWPSGVRADGEGFLLSLSLATTIERRSLTDPTLGTAIFRNISGYPGRIAPASAGTGRWWVAVPYLRNRATELMLGDPEFVADMVENLTPDAWLTPRLAVENPFTAPLQLGQMRVLEQVKPWAPSRTYGLAFEFDGRGRILQSAHSRADGNRHGVTAVVPWGDAIAVLAAGAGAVVELEDAR